MPHDVSEEIIFQLLPLSVAARGWVAYAIAVPVALILAAIAWRIVVGTWPKKPSAG